jgi:hypothetical protein
MKDAPSVVLVAPVSSLCLRMMPSQLPPAQTQTTGQQLASQSTQLRERTVRHVSLGRNGAAADDHLGTRTHLPAARRSRTADVNQIREVPGAQLQTHRSSTLAPNARVPPMSEVERPPVVLFVGLFFQRVSERTV